MKYYCKCCGAYFDNIQNLLHNRCSKSSTGCHELYEGSEKSKYYCKYCGASFGDLMNLTHNRCTKSPTGEHVPAL